MWEDYSIGKEEVEWGRTRTRGGSCLCRSVPVSLFISFFFSFCRVISEGKPGIGFTDFTSGIVFTSGILFILNFTLVLIQLVLLLYPLAGKSSYSELVCFSR